MRRCFAGGSGCGAAGCALHERRGDEGTAHQGRALGGRMANRHRRFRPRAGGRHVLNVRNINGKGCRVARVDRLSLSSAVLNVWAMDVCCGVPFLSPREIKSLPFKRANKWFVFETFMYTTAVVSYLVGVVVYILHEYHTRRWYQVCIKSY